MFGCQLSCIIWTFLDNAFSGHAGDKLHLTRAMGSVILMFSDISFHLFHLFHLKGPKALHKGGRRTRYNKQHNETQKEEKNAGKRLNIQITMAIA